MENKLSNLLSFLRRILIGDLDSGKKQHMENDFINIGALLGIMIFPFVIIFLMLMVFNWSERKNLFSDSWFVYLAWMFLGLLTALACLIVDDRFSIEETAPIMATFYLSIVSIQTTGIAAVLYWRSGRKNAASLVCLTEEIADAPPARKIWKTAFLVSVLTSLMMVGLFVALADIDRQLSPRDDGVSFGIYD